MRRTSAHSPSLNFDLAPSIGRSPLSLPPHKQALADAAKATAGTEPAIARLAGAARQVPELVAGLDAALAVALHSLDAASGAGGGSGGRENAR